MNAAVVAFPRNDGLNVRGPTARLTMATTPTMTTSRLMTVTVSQSGRWLVRGIAGRVRTTNVVTSSSLSAIGSSQAPRLVRWPARRAMRPSSASVRPATLKTISAPPEVPVDNEQDERGNQRDSQNRQLVGQREILH